MGPMNITIDPELIRKLGAEEKLWSAAHYDGSKNRINEDAILEAGSVSLGILTALALWCRKRFRNRGKTKEDLAAEKEAAPRRRHGARRQSAGGFGAVRDELLRQRDLLKG